MNIWIQSIGFVAALLTTLAFLPQAIKVLREGGADGLSLEMYIVFVSGTTLWTLYGFLVWDLAIIFANIITTSLACLILIVILHTRKQEKADGLKASHFRS